MSDPRRLPLNALPAFTRAALALVVIPLAAIAGSFIVPPDRELIEAADAIAVVTIGSHHSWRDPAGLILTEYVAAVGEPLKGALAEGETIVITELGGVVGERGMISSTAPRFVDGQRALVFLVRRGARWTTHSGRLGKFDFVRDGGAAIHLARGASDEQIFGWDWSGNAHVERVRDAVAFLEYIHAVVRGQKPEPGYFRESAGVSSPVYGEGKIGAASTYSGNAFLMQFGFSPAGGARWPSGGFSMRTSGTQSGSAAAASGGASVWTSDPSSNISINIAGTVAGIDYGDTGTSTNVLNFGVPESFSTKVNGVSQTPLAGNVVGQALLWASSATNTNLSGESFYTATDCDVIIQSTLSGVILNEVVAHELGHCLGFRHSNEGTPSSDDALMFSSATGKGAVLKAWDREAANEVYGDGSFGSCALPVITSQPQNPSIAAGESANLSVSASGASSYQWYRGISGTATNPIAGATAAAYNTGPLTATSQYWVRVTNSCGSVDSVTATVTIACPKPSIAVQPQSSSIGSGKSVTLSVVASGGPLAYQWYRGSSGIEAQPIPGATASAYTTPVLASTSSFWVKVTNACGSTNSATAILTVCAAPSILTQPKSATIGPGQSVTLSVLAAGATDFQWYRGLQGTTTNPIPGATGATYITGPLTATSQYWVRASNSCSSVDSETATVTVGCSLAITQQPQSVTLQKGQTATFTVAATGPAPLTYQWYVGASGDESQPIAGATSTTLTIGPIEKTTTFWVEVTSPCGSANSQTATAAVPARKRLVRR